MKRNEIISEFKKGVKAVKYNKKPKNPAADHAKAKEKLQPVKPLEETNEGRWDRKDAYQRDYDSSVSGFGKDSYAYRMDGGANDEGWDEEEPRLRRHSPAADTPHDVYIDGRKWKTFDSASHAKNVARKLQAKGKNVSVRASSTDEAMGDELGKITKVDPATKKATLTKSDGSSMEVDSTALKPTPDGKMSMDTPDTDELKTGTAVVSTEDTAQEDMVVPSNDSSSPINGDEKNIDLRRIRELAGQPPAEPEMPGQNMPPTVLNLDDIDPKTLDSAEGFKAVLTKAAGEAGVEGDISQNVNKMVASAPDGSVDMEKTLVNMMAGFADAADALAKLIEDFITAYETAMKHPDYAKLTQEEKQSVVDALQEMKAKLPELQKHAQEVRAQHKAYQQDKQSAPPAQDAELARIQELAGLIAEEITDLGNGVSKTTKPDGSYEIRDETGIKTYNAQGKLIKTGSPNFAGSDKTTDHETGNVTTNYNAGPLRTSQTTDKTGKPITTKANYDLGIAKVDTELDHRSGIRSNTIDTPGMDPNDFAPTADIAASKGVDPKKFAAFQKQNPSAVKSPALEAMLRIAGLR